MSLQIAQLFYQQTPEAPTVTLAELSVPFRHARYLTVKRNAHLLSPHFSWCPPDFNALANARCIMHQMQQQRYGHGYYFVILDDLGNFAGEIGLDAIFPYQRSANLFFWVDHLHGRKGLATQAVNLLCKWAALHQPLDCLEIRMETTNLASKRVAEKSGAIFQETVRHYQHRNGKVSDVHLYKLTL